MLCMLRKGQSIVFNLTGDKVGSPRADRHFAALTDRIMMPAKNKPKLEPHSKFANKGSQGYEITSM